MEFISQPLVLVLMSVACVALFIYAWRDATRSIVHNHNFLEGHKVRFSPKALNELRIADREIHVVAEADHICDGIIGLLNYPVELSMAGHHQRIRLDNGFIISGAWLLPA